MAVRPAKPEESDAWLAMRMALWPETDEARHRQEMVMMTSDTQRYAVLVCETPSGLVGFAEVALREWAEGCLSSPVGYLEGWYVAEGERHKGYGRALLTAAEAWARSRGCSEMASDTNLGNELSKALHLKLGYEVTAQVIAFRKKL